MLGNFGYELDLTQFTVAEKEEVKRQVALVKEVRELVQFGTFYRLLSPFDGNETAWMFVSKDKKEAFLVHITILNEPNAPLSRLRLKGLDPNYSYEWVGENQSFGGSLLRSCACSRVQSDGQPHTL
ncbi:hypothetical protein Back11_04360 [Paenibacillus baekrokdamisoli]|uniref:Uncharacterized protein n=1 Tax=Paenibacillus baekrokdamisoli TaxID=1712516 RepID=A0A3G9IZP0_9BACL|nr:alpha-galactosidase [Paenibacillus baekrokdamisoli]BBH19091.1 hypothetical protein Back11_04360 [Paenibacillus baekrokdamisoli]